MAMPRCPPEYVDVLAVLILGHPTVIGKFPYSDMFVHVLHLTVLRRPESATISRAGTLIYSFLVETVMIAINQFYSNI